MSGDEIIASFVSIAVAILCWGRWYWTVLVFPRAMIPRLVLALVPPICAVLLFCVLRLWASHDVRDDPTYPAFYLLMGAAWVGASLLLLPMMAMNTRQDVVERQNTAAAWTVAGAIAGITACFAGANIGEGPGWWVVTFAGLLSTAGLFAVWAIVQGITGAADSITIDRDSATGIRLGAVLVVVGLILARAVAGNWISASSTVHDFLISAWPVLPLLVCEAILGCLLRPSPQTPIPPQPIAGFLPALVYFAWGLAALKILGPPA